MKTKISLWAIALFTIASSSEARIANRTSCQNISGYGSVHTVSMCANSELVLVQPAPKRIWEEYQEVCTVWVTVSSSYTQGFDCSGHQL